MFESTLFQILSTDPTLTGYLSSYDGTPSVFSNMAPENVEFRYLVFRIDGTTGPDSAVDTFDIIINIFDYSYSSKNIRLAGRRCIELLDRKHFSHEYFDTIRVFRDTINYIDSESPQAQHYEYRFTARAGRSGWMGKL